MSRSKWKSVFITKSILKNSSKVNLKKIWCRNSVIPYAYLNSKVLVYTGNQFRTIHITEDKIGFKFGEFSFTRKRVNKNFFNKSKQKGKKK